MVYLDSFIKAEGPCNVYCFLFAVEKFRGFRGFVAAKVFQ